jgi:hypothetical protein
MKPAPYFFTLMARVGAHGCAPLRIRTRGKGFNDYPFKHLKNTNLPL